MTGRESPETAIQDETRYRTRTSPPCRSSPVLSANPTFGPMSGGLHSVADFLRGRSVGSSAVRKLVPVALMVGLIEG